MALKQHLLDRINTQTAQISVVGLGYVGLPLAVEFAEAGYQVIGLDVDQQKVDRINQGISYIEDIPTARLQALVANGRLRATANYADLATVDAISICVPTPLNQTKDPDLKYVLSAMQSIQAILHEGILIVLESTTYPGTTQEVVQPSIESAGYRIGETIFVAFSGERIDPGNKTYGLHNTPKVIGGVTPACAEITVTLYGTIIDQIVPVSSPAAAEMVKLVENTFRSVNIGLANEIAIMCQHLGLNVWEIIEAAATKPFGFMPHYPGPGVGGHCIPLDPHYLSWKLRTTGYHARFIELASQINEMMPQVVVNKIADALNDDAKPLRGSRIVVMGVAYKRDIDDVRESPALHVIALLAQKGADVVYHDPHVPQLHLHDGQGMSSTAYTPHLLQSADCVVIITDHTVFDREELLANSVLIMDTRNALAGQQSGQARVITL